MKIPKLEICSLSLMLRPPPWHLHRFPPFKIYVIIPLGYLDSKFHFEKESSLLQSIEQLSKHTVAGLPESI